MTLKYNLVQNGEQGALTAFFNGEMYTADDTHASWSQLVAAVVSPDPDLTALGRLFDPAVGIQNYFKRVSERVSVAGGHVFIDGEEINDGLANNIIRFMNEDKNDKAMALVNFLEKVSTNLNEHSREQLYDFLSRHDFAINDAGNFLAYKGVINRKEDADNFAQYPYESSSSGKAIVDGKVYTGRIPNGLGAVVEMPRGEVQHDPSVGCHTGLHAGTYEYASTFTSGPCLLVEINPRDVVSVPTDCNWQKIRTCRYTVVEIVGNKLTDMYYSNEEHIDELDEDYSYDEPYYGSEYDAYN